MPCALSILHKPAHCPASSTFHDSLCQALEIQNQTSHLEPKYPAPHGRGSISSPHVTNGETEAQRGTKGVMWVTQKEHPTHQSALSVLPGFGTLTLGNRRHFIGTSGLGGRGREERNGGGGVYSCRESSAGKTEVRTGKQLAPGHIAKSRGTRSHFGVP